MGLIRGIEVPWKSKSCVYRLLRNFSTLRDKYFMYWIDNWVCGDARITKVHYLNVPISFFCVLLLPKQQSCIVINGLLELSL